jgi:hypothetical protein
VGFSSPRDCCVTTLSKSHIESRGRDTPILAKLLSANRTLLTSKYLWRVIPVQLPCLKTSPDSKGQGSKCLSSYLGMSTLLTPNGVVLIRSALYVIPGSKGSLGVLEFNDLNVYLRT